LNNHHAEVFLELVRSHFIWIYSEGCLEEVMKKKLLLGNRR